MRFWGLTVKAKDSSKKEATLSRRVYDQVNRYGLVTPASVASFFDYGVRGARRFLEMLRKERKIRRFEVERGEKKPFVYYGFRRLALPDELNASVAVLRFCRLETEKRELISRKQHTSLTSRLAHELQVPSPPYCPTFLKFVDGTPWVYLIRVIRTNEQESVIIAAEDFVNKDTDRFSIWRMVARQEHLYLVLLVPADHRTITELRRRFSRRPVVAWPKQIRISSHTAVPVPVIVYSYQRVVPADMRDPRHRKSVRIGQGVTISLQGGESGERTGIVTEVLTQGRDSRRGVRVRLEDGSLGRVKKILPGKSDQGKEPTPNSTAHRDL